MTPTTQAVDTAFTEKPNLKASIHEAISQQPSLGGLFSSISEYVIELRNQSTARGADLEEPAAKKRRLNGTGQALPDRSNGAESGNMNALWSSTPQIETSFFVPQRKKLLLQISPKTSEGIRALNPGTKEKEFGISWKDIEHVICLPVPEKAQATYNFCVFPKSIGGPEGSSSYEPMVWTVPEVKAKELEEGKPNLRQTMTEAVKAAQRNVLEPDSSEFVSEVQQAYRKGEKAYHVKAFRGSKDGFLFFLSTGIVWAFKKPLHFFSFDTVSSISYTSVLQRTFNLNLTTQSSSSPQTQEFEFSMIDQADFAGIDAYVKRHQLQDASMAEERRAKKLNINGVKGELEVEDGEEESELQKAAREAEVREGEEDDEDEEDDENFDPGSEGESEGSGTDDEEEEDREGEGGGEGDDDDEDLEEELGSGDEMPT